MLSQWIMMRGYPGSGKSTLAEGMAASGAAVGLAVDLFGEEQLFTRPEFAAVADGFRSTSYASPATFLRAYEDYLSSTSADWLIWDWSAVGMVNDLGWATDDPVLRRHLADVSGLVRPGVLQVLDVQAQVESCVRRAASQRGAEWIRRYAELAAAAGHSQGSALQRITRYVADTPLLDQAFVAAAASGWPAPQPIDADGTPEETLEAALRAVPAAKEFRSAGLFQKPGSEH